MGEAMKVFVDKTGKHGPAGWEVGRLYRAEKRIIPLPESPGTRHLRMQLLYRQAVFLRYFTGVLLAETHRTKEHNPAEQFQRKFDRHPWEAMEGISAFGIYDLAGNVREWCAN
jgi:hypothetical protein